MTYLTYLTILSLVVVFALSSELQYRSENMPITAGHPAMFTIPPSNFRGNATINLVHSGNVSICVVRSEFLLPYYDQYNADICTYFYNWTSGSTTSTVDLPLRYLSYTVGVYYADPANNKTNLTASLSVTGSTCEWPTFYDGTQCINSIQIRGLNKTHEVSTSFKDGETQFFWFDSPDRVGHLKFEYNAPDHQVMVSFARWMASPSDSLHDYHETESPSNVTSGIHVPQAKPGIWIFSLHMGNGPSTKKASYNVTVGVSGEVCHEGVVGENCQTVVLPASNNSNATAEAHGQGNIAYHRVVLNKTHPFLKVSVYTPNTTLLPHLWVTRGQIPAKKEFADIVNCNRRYCELVHRVAHNFSESTDVEATEEEWFIAVIPSDVQNTQYAIWFDSDCIDGCETDNHGVCQDSGICVCEIDFAGLDCGTSRGLGPQYIVLIIIASLVVASAVIGFVAWAYMRRKRANYEILS